jgi:curved DNA-binding protein CbpA
MSGQLLLRFQLHGVLTALRLQIAAAFRRLALELHPDRHVGGNSSARDQAANRFKAVTEAYEILSNGRRLSLAAVHGLKIHVQAQTSMLCYQCISQCMLPETTKRMLCSLLPADAQRSAYLSRHSSSYRRNPYASPYTDPYAGSYDPFGSSFDPSWKNQRTRRCEE